MTTISNFLHFTDSKKNTFRESYLRKYGTFIVKGNYHDLSRISWSGLYTTTTAVEMEKNKIETSATQEPHEIEYVDVKLFSEEEEKKVGIGKPMHG